MEVPLATALRPGPRAPADRVARAIALGLAPEEAADSPPPWLRPGQEISFRRALAAIRRHGAALLADPVGSGKTFVALAVGAALAPRAQPSAPLTCLVPAALRSQWQEAIRRTGIAAVVHSHELASRGRLPATDGPVIIDESHRFRNAATRRYAHVADWLLGRPLLLLSATPMVNRAADLARQLRLGVADDALAAGGLPSLAALAPDGAAALGALVIARSRVEGLPAAHATGLAPGVAPGFGLLLAGLDRLRLSRDPAVASLIRVTLLRSLASSPCAFAGALHRYRMLLLQARDAHDAGRVAGRSALRALGGCDGTQLVMWSLLALPAAEWELELDDADALTALADRAAGVAQDPASDPRALALARLLGDGRPTVVFTAFRETVAALGRLLPHAAWLTGSRAGIGPARISRAAALAPFRRTGGPCAREPRQLLATDVAAEGLDLRGVSRVVNFDLPWTDVRLVQRAGRARRLGARHASVEVVTFAPPPSLERRLGLGSALGRKRHLAERLLEAPVWRWAAALAELARGEPGVEGVAEVPVRSAAESGVLAGLVIEEAGERTRPVAGWVGWSPGSGAAGTWTAAREAVAPRLAALLAAGPAATADEAPTAGALSETALSGLAHEAARLLRLAAAARLGTSPRAPGGGQLRRHLLAAAADARRARSPERLARLEEWLAFLARGHTGGEARLVERLASGPAGSGAFAAPPPRAPGDPAERAASGAALRVRLTGVVVFRAGRC